MKETTGEDHPRHVGPYRIESRLGRGGVGEVWRAWDERLERWVAVKRLHDENGAAGRGILREARAAARLAHPAIVQVFDVLEQDGVGWIVMEVVEGSDLATVTGGGLLDVAVVLSYARQVAEGLAAAHAAGIVHRDLKSQNVMVLPTGRIKIVDFGLAKKQPLDGTEGTSSALSIPGRVIGTPRAMSPEQALGRAVDFRADLFALGVLIYELLTGFAPFRGTTVSQSLARVVTHQPVPVEKLNPEVPPALAELVARLLEKDPVHRPAGAAEVAETLAALASGERIGVTRPAGSLYDATTLGDGSGVEGRTQKAVAKRGWAAILVFAGVAFVFWAVFFGAPASNLSQRLVVVLETVLGAGSAGGEETDNLAYTVRHALVRALSSFVGFASTSTKEVDALTGPPTAVAHALGADEVLESTLDCRAFSGGGRTRISECSLEVLRVDGTDGRILGTYRFDVPPAPLLDAARTMEIGVRKEIYPGAELRPGVSGIETTPEDFATYVAIRRVFDKRPGLHEAVILRGQLARLQERSPRFVEATILEAQVAVYCYQQTRKPELLDRAFERVAKARSLAPENPRVLLELAYVEIQANWLDEAEKTLEALASLAPGEVAILDLRAELFVRRGETAAGLALARMALARNPSWERLYRYARIATELGEVDLAREILSRLLEEYPEHNFGLSSQAKLELVNGDPRRAVEIYDKLILRASSPKELAGLGLALVLLGDYSAASAAFESAVDAAPNDALYLLNLADSRWLEGEREEARYLYRRVLSLRPSSPTARQLMRHAQALAQLGRGEEAVAVTREALGMSPEDPDVNFEAALVFTLAGDPEQALVYAEKAVDLGYEHRWFELPWFDEFRAAHPGFAAAGARIRRQRADQPPPVGGPGSSPSGTEG